MARAPIADLGDGENGRRAGDDAPDLVTIDGVAAARIGTVARSGDRTLAVAPAAAKIGDIAASAGIRRVHVLAWRDLDDVEAGGSEVHADHVASRWAAAGVEVTMRTSFAAGHAPRIRRHGYEVVRRSGRYQVFPRAVLAELTGRAGPSDAIVEIWNGMPFFTPVWHRGPRLVVLHHVHAEMWRMVLGDDAPVLAAAGDLLERRVAPKLYRGSPIATLSASSKADIVEQLGLDPAQIVVAPPGIDAAFNPGEPAARWDGSPHVVSVGRLVPVKRHDLLIRAAAVARAQIPGLTLTLVGDGYERPALEALVAELDAADWITFTGHIDDDRLVALYRSAGAVASASLREGWGMALTEAAACGTPSVATRIPGHVDAVAEGHSGLLTDSTPLALGAALAEVVGDPARRRQLATGALAHAEQFTWDATAAQLMAALATDALRRRPRR